MKWPTGRITDTSPKFFGWYEYLIPMIARRDGLIHTSVTAPYGRLCELAQRFDVH